MIHRPSSAQRMIRIGPPTRCTVAICHRQDSSQIAAALRAKTSPNRQLIAPIHVLPHSPQSAKLSRAALAGHPADALSP